MNMYLLLIHDIYTVLYHAQQTDRQTHIGDETICNRSAYTIYVQYIPVPCILYCTTHNRQTATHIWVRKQYAIGVLIQYTVHTNTMYTVLYHAQQTDSHTHR